MAKKNRPKPNRSGGFSGTSAEKWLTSESTEPRNDVEIRFHEALAHDQQPNSHSASAPQYSQAVKGHGWPRWQAMVLSVLLAIMGGLVAGAGFAILLIDGKLDVSKESFKALLRMIFPA